MYNIDILSSTFSELKNHKELKIFFNSLLNNTVVKYIVKIVSILVKPQR